GRTAPITPISGKLPAHQSGGARGEFGVLAGLHKNEITTTPLSEVVAHKKEIDVRLVELARILD
ncbi:MAG TPA: hypothetical protein VF326_03045, partial [Anaerolineaceae bacterium]